MRCSARQCAAHSLCLSHVLVICRLGFSARAFLTNGQVPGVGEANHNEPLLPWVGFNQVSVMLLGSRLCPSPGPDPLCPLPIISCVMSCAGGGSCRGSRIACFFFVPMEPQESPSHQCSGGMS